MWFGFSSVAVTFCVLFHNYLLQVRFSNRVVVFDGNMHILGVTFVHFLCE